MIAESVLELQLLAKVADMELIKKLEDDDPTMFEFAKANVGPLVGTLKDFGYDPDDPPTEYFEWLLTLMAAMGYISGCLTKEGASDIL